MARNAALVTTWLHPSRGREGKALESFTDFLTYWGKMAADGKCEEPEVFFAADGSKGFAVVRGPSDVLNAARETEDYERLTQRAQFTVEDLRTEMYVTGDQEIQKSIQIFGEIGGELGYL